MRPPKKYHHTPSTPKHRVSSSTSKKENDDNDATARTGPRVSPDTLRGVGKRFTRRPLGRTATPAGVTTSVSRRQGFLPTPQKTTHPDALNCSTNLTAHQHTPSRYCSHIA